jgi:hypothetical protein
MKMAEQVVFQFIQKFEKAGQKWALLGKGSCCCIQSCQWAIYDTSFIRSHLNMLVSYLVFIIKME